MPIDPRRQQELAQYRGMQQPLNARQLQRQQYLQNQGNAGIDPRRQAEFSQYGQQTTPLTQRQSDRQQFLQNHYQTPIGARVPQPPGAPPPAATPPPAGAGYAELGFGSPEEYQAYQQAQQQGNANFGQQLQGGVLGVGGGQMANAGGPQQPQLTGGTLLPPEAQPRIPSPAITPPQPTQRQLQRQQYVQNHPRPAPARPPPMPNFSQVPGYRGPSGVAPGGSWTGTVTPQPRGLMAPPPNIRQQATQQAMRRMR